MIHGGEVELTRLFGEIRKDGKFDPIFDPLYMHEYGHYLQSQRFGFCYLYKIGIPSLISSTLDIDLDYAPYHLHNLTSMETDANKRAAYYFKKNYGIDWHNTDYYKTSMTGITEVYHCFDIYPYRINKRGW